MTGFAQPVTPAMSGLISGSTQPAIPAMGNVVTGISQAVSPGGRLQNMAPSGTAPVTVAEDVTTTPQGTDELNRVLSRARGAARNDPPSQFQKFVQESTGTLLPNFGSQLFDAPQNYVPDAGLAIPANYILGPGDEVRIQIWGGLDYSSSLVIDREGKITLPKVGALNLSGVSVANLEQVLKSHLSKAFTNFDINASLGRLRSVQVYVVGQARQPGTYAVSSLSTLINVLFASGGPNANGSMRAIELQRAGKVITKMDLYRFIAKGDKSSDAVVQPGDVVFIPPALRRVAITGAYDQAAIYELSERGTTIEELLNLGGGASPVASTRKALLERVYADRVPARQVADLALDPKGMALPLASGDILTLLPVSPEFANAVTLQGVVADPLRYPWFQGMKVLDLIPNRDALITPNYHRRKNKLTQNEQQTDRTNDSGSIGLDDRVRNSADQINWDYAVIERLNKDKLSTELIPFNLGRAVLFQDPTHNLELQAGDVLTVLSQKDLALPQERQSRLVRLEGEVAVPGIYQAAPGETLPQLIKRVGGLTAQAYVFGIEFGRESVRSRQQANLATLIRKLEAELQGQLQVGLPSGSQDATGAASLLQQQRQLLQSQISRLKSLRSNGRMALELDPSARTLAALPAVPLEDGDRILVPSVPGYVAALGAVNNENAIIYKPGKTAGDVLRAAGITDNAEPDGAFVLRADGSVVSKKDRTGFFGGGFDSLPVMPGDTLVVPAKLDTESGYAFTVRALKDWTQIISNLGIGAAAIKTLSN